MIIGFDIGNTSSVLGVYDENSAIPQGIFRYPTNKKATEDDFSGIIYKQINLCSGTENTAGPKKIIISSVVPEINNSIARAVKNSCDITPHFINYLSRMKIALNYGSPEDLGSDRICNAEAANAEYPGDKLIIDFGTATTISVLLADGKFDGGLILPGTATALDSLHQKTSKLPKIELGVPERISAQGTADAIKSGIYYGWISMVEGLTAKLEIFYGKKFKLILTGGYAELISKGLALSHAIDPLLTMKGIKYLADLN